MIPRLKSLGLNTTDYFILDWIYTFALSNKMLSCNVQDPKTKAVTTYYWINYKSLIEDFEGYLDFENPRTLRRILDKYQEANILTKKIFNKIIDNDGKERKGVYTMVALNMDMYLYLTGENIQDKGKDDTEDMDTDVQGSSYAPNADGQQCPQGMDNTVPTPLDKNVRTNINKLYNHKAIASAKNFDKTKNDNSQTENADNQNLDSCGDIKSFIAGLFNEKSYTLRFDFYANLTSAFNNTGLTDFDKQKQYLKHIYEYSLRQGATNLKSYFMAVAPKTDHMQHFMTSLDKEYTQQQLQTKSYAYTCPSCGHVHVEFQDCPNCTLHDPNDEEEVERCRHIAKLSPDVRELMDYRLQELYSSTGLDINAIRLLPQQKLAIYREFGV